MDTEKQNTHTEQREIDLKTLREAKGLTLQDIARETRISLSVLEAIEEKRFRELPEPVYTRAFIKSYATAMDIDEHDILSLYDSYVEEIESKMQEAVEADRERTSSSRKRVITSLVIGVVVLAALFIFFLNSGPDGDTPTVAPMTKQEPPATPAPAPEMSTAKTDTPSAKAETPPASPAPASQRAATPPIQEEPVENTQPEGILPGTHEKSLPTQATPATEERPTVEVQVIEDTPDETRTEPYVLEIEGTELSWMKITEDANEPYEIMLRPGRKITRTATKKFTLHIGNAGGVLITFQGKALGAPGKHGQVVHLVLPAQDGND